MYITTPSLDRTLSQWSSSRYSGAYKIEYNLLGCHWTTIDLIETITLSVDSIASPLVEAKGCLVMVYLGHEARHFALWSHVHSCYLWCGEKSQIMRAIPKENHSTYLNRFMFLKINCNFLFVKKSWKTLLWHFGMKGYFWFNLCYSCIYAFHLFYCRVLCVVIFFLLLYSSPIYILDYDNGSMTLLEEWSFGDLYP